MMKEAGLNDPCKWCGWMVVSFWCSRSSRSSSCRPSGEGTSCRYEDHTHHSHQIQAVIEWRCSYEDHSHHMVLLVRHMMGGYMIPTHTSSEAVFVRQMPVIGRSTL